VLCPLVLLCAWWTQRFLLAGLVSWSTLLPDAVVITTGPAAVSVTTSVHLSHAVVSNADRYGPSSVVFLAMTWLTWFSVVLPSGVPS
jgi:hypothetical protein